MSISKVREYCEKRIGQVITQRDIISATGLPRQKCSTILASMRRNGEIKKIGNAIVKTGYMFYYEVIEIKQEVKSNPKLAVDYLNRIGIGYIFSVAELCAVIKCSPGPMRHMVRVSINAGSLKKITLKRIYRYEVIGEIAYVTNFDKNKQKSGPKKNNKAIEIVKDNSYCFAFGVTVMRKKRERVMGRVKYKVKRKVDMPKPFLSETKRGVNMLALKMEKQSDEFLRTLP